MQGSSIAVMSTKYLWNGGKDWKLYAAFIDLDKAYVRVGRRALRDVLLIYGVDKSCWRGLRPSSEGQEHVWEYRVIKEETLVHVSV